MQVTKKDESSERFILGLIKKHIPAFRKVKFEQGLGASLFDFWGFKKNGDKKIGVDVKVRDIRSTAYSDYFISKDKMSMVFAKLEMQFFAIYYFSKDRKVRVYDLSNPKIEEREIKFTHKRTGKEMKQDVFAIPAMDHIFDCYLI